MTSTTLQYATSKDGTTIAYDRLGTGPAVVLVSGGSVDRSSNAGLAEQLATDALQIGTEGGQPDATTLFGTQLAFVSWQRGTLSELVPLIEQMAAETPGIPALMAGVALAHGLILSVMVTALMRISGHFNPAVTIGFMAVRRIEPVMG